MGKLVRPMYGVLPADYRLFIDLVIATSALLAALFWFRSATLRQPDFTRITTFTNFDDSGRLPIGVWSQRLAAYNRKAAACASVAALGGAIRLSLGLLDVEGAVIAMLEKPDAIAASNVVAYQFPQEADADDPRRRLYVPGTYTVNARTVPKPLVPEFSHTVTANRLNVRTGPGSANPLVLTLNSGDRVRVDRTDGNWSFLTGDGYEGWAFSRYLSAAN